VTTPEFPSTTDSDTTEDSPRKLKVAYLVSHPIQYQAPLLRRLAQEPDLSVTAFFRSDHSVKGYIDKGFGVRVEWDIPLTEGYPHEFLPAVGRTDVLTRWRPFNYGLGRALRSGGHDAFWTHGFGAPYQLWAILRARLSGLPVLLRDETHANSRKRSWLGRLRASFGFAFLKMNVSKFLAIGTANAQYYLQHGVSPDQIHLVPYTVDNAFFGVRKLSEKPSAKATVMASLGLQSNRPLILFAAKLQKRKRCSDLIRAFLADGVHNHESQPVLLIVGDGEEMALCQELAAGSAPSEAIHFLGFKNQTELRPLYQASDVFVLPSDSEAWGLTINEAMSAGCAIISSAEVGAVADLVKEGVNGFTFEAGDVAGLTQALKLALAEPGKLHAMSQESLNLIGRWSFEEDVAGLRAALGLPARPAEPAPI